MFIKQSTAYTFRMGPFLNDTDGKTAESSLSIGRADIRLSKNGGAFAQRNAVSPTNLTEDEFGYYILALDATDTATVGELLIAVHESGALPVFKTFQVVEEAIYDGIYGGSADLITNIDSILEDTGTTIPATITTIDNFLDTEIAAILSDTNDILVDTGTTIPATITTIDNFLDTEIAAILEDTAEIGSAGAGLTAVPYNSAWNAEIQSECADALTAYDPPTKAELDAAFTAIKGASWASGTDTLEAIRDRGDAAWTSGSSAPTASAVADAVWDEATSGHTTSGTFGEQVKTDIDAILLDTVVIGAAGAGLTAVPYNNDWDADIQSECADALTAYDAPTKAELDTAHSTTDALITTVNTAASAIKVVTDAISTNGSGLSAIPWNSSWDAEVESEVAEALVAIGLDHLVSASVAGSDIVDNSIIAKLVSKESTADWDDFVNTTDSLQALRDRGDASWVTGGSASAIADAVWDEATSGHTSAGSYGKALSDILTDTTVIGALGAGLTAIPWNSSWDAEIESECAEALAAIGLDHIVSASVAGSDVADNSIVAKLVSKESTADWDDFVNTTDSLQAVRDRGDAAWTTGGGGSAAAIADAVWDEATSGHTTSGTFGEQVKTDIDSILLDTGTTLDGKLNTIDNFLDTEVANILADTAELQGDWEDGGRLDALLDSVISKVDAVDDLVDTEVAAIKSVVDDILVDTGTTLPATLNTIDNFLDTEVAAILGDTAELQGDWEDGGRLDALLDSIITKVNAVDDLVDTEVAAIKTVVDDILVDTAVIGAAGAGLTAVPWNASWDAEVQSEVSDALVAYDPPTKAEMDAMWTTAMVESYAEDNVDATPAQILYMILCAVSEFSIDGTTITGKEIDGSTTAMTWTLDDATSPTSRTRAS